MRKNMIIGIALVVTLAAVLVGIQQVYAHCGKCKTDAKYFAGALDSSKMTLAAAATLAEVATEGTAVHATVLRLDKGVNVEVHCLAGGKIVAVVVDGKTGKVVGKGNVDNLGAHASL